MFGTKTMAVAAYAAAKRKQGMGKTNLKVKKTVDKRKDSCSTVGVSRHMGQIPGVCLEKGAIITTWVSFHLNVMQRRQYAFSSWMFERE